jgi:hypothetical protein
MVLLTVAAERDPVLEVSAPHDETVTWKGFPLGRPDERRREFQNIRITIGEKHGGRWKIAFQAFLRDPEQREGIVLPE